MEHAPLVINRGINQRVSGAAIFGLHMQCVRSEFEIGVVPEDHQLPLCLPARRTTPALCHARGKIFLREYLTAWLPTRYYNALTMSPTGLQAYVPLVIHLLVAAFLAGVLI